MNIAVILAGGLGSRMGRKVPKQFLEINSKPILLTTLEVFCEMKEFKKIIVVAPRDWVQSTKDLLRDVDSRIEVITGGETRQQSTFSALIKLKKDNTKEGDVIVVHDGVRPFVKQDEIREGIRLTEEFGAATGAVKTTDAVVRATDFITEIPDKSQIYLTRSPDVFQFGLIYQAHKDAAKKKIDNSPSDYQLIFNQGCKVKIFAVSYENIKITTPADLKLAQKIIDERNGKNS